MIMEYWKELYKKAIRIAEIDSFIKDRNEGEKREIGEYGSKISGGQMQIVAIARSIYRNKEILVFDEATNALDKKLEESNWKYNFFRRRKPYFYTHNNAVLKFCNRVINLSNS